MCVFYKKQFPYAIIHISYTINNKIKQHVHNKKIEIKGFDVKDYKKKIHVLSVGISLCYLKSSVS